MDTYKPVNHAWSDFKKNKLGLSWAKLSHSWGWDWDKLE